MDYDAPTISSDSSTELHNALRPIATSALTIAARDDIVAEIQNFRADIGNQMVVLRGDLVGQIDAMRRTPADETENPDTEMERLHQELRDGLKSVPSMKQLLSVVVVGYASIGLIVAAALFALR